MSSPKWVYVPDPRCGAEAKFATTLAGTWPTFDSSSWKVVGNRSDSLSEVTVATESVSKQQPEPRFPITSVKPVRADLGPAGASQLINISASGIRVKSLAPLRRDAEVPVRIDIPDRLESLRCSGVVVWSKPNGAAGLKLKDLNETQQKILKGWLADFEKGERTPPRVEERDEFAAIVTQIKESRMNNADALNLIARRITEFTSASGVIIALGKPEHMICLASEGDAPEVGTPVPAGGGLTSECMRGRRMVLCQNAATDPRVKKDAGFSSAAILPLLVKGDLRGMLQVFSKKPCAFDPKSLDGLEELADAVVMVMFGVTPQRRVGAISEPSQPVTPQSKIVTRNGTLSPTESGNWVFTVPTRAATLAPETIMPAATTATSPAVETPAATVVPIAAAITPTVQAAAIQPVIAPVVPPPIQPPVAPVPMPRRETNIIEMPKPQPAPAQELRIFEEAAEEESSSPGFGKWIAVVAAVVLIAAIPLGYYGWQHLHTVTVAQAAPPSNVQPAAVPQSAITVPSTTVTVTPTSTTAVSENVSAPVKEVENKSHDTREPEKLQPKPIEPVVPKPEPITLAAGRSMKPATPVDDSDVAAPSAQFGSIGVASAPAVALPATPNLPKLAAPVAKTWSGGTLIKRVPPPYPAAARSQSLQGAVELHVMIMPDGTIDKIKVVNGNPILARAAIDAVKLWRYDPFKADNVPVSKEADITLNFTMPR